MKFKRHLKKEAALEQINIAPLIDIILQLLIFFMLTSSFTFPSGIHVKLPKAVTSDIIQEENFIITITSENVIYLNNKVMTAKELKEALKIPAQEKRPILIKADRRASLGRIVDVWDLCRGAGVERINIAANREQ